MNRLLISFVLSASALHGEEPKVLLVSPPDLKEAWHSYAEARAEQGVPMKVVTTEEIQNDYTAGDLANRIRLCARKHIEEGFEAIILGGDSEPGGGLIPDRDTVHQTMWGEEFDTPSDLYFISPTNWDLDGDGIYGEFTDDRAAISYPDGSVAIGRIPVRTATDIEAYGAKVKAHLEAAASEELAFTCTVSGAYAKVKRSAEMLIPEAWPKGKVSIFFSDITSWDGDQGAGSYDLSCENLAMKFTEINKWHLHGHGLTDRWQLEGDEPFSYEQVENLKNADRPLVITTVSCFTGHFDGEEDPCISEAMLRQPGGGAVIMVAPAREGKPHFHDPDRDFPLMMQEGKLDGTTQTMASFWIAALSEKKANAGHALAHSKAGLAEDAAKSATYHQGICEINLLGDPTLPVR